MKHLHIPTILVTLGLVGLVAILSGQSTVGTPRVVVHNPLGVPGWVPSDVWMAGALHDQATGTFNYLDYTVPAGHFALLTSGAAYSAGSIVQVDTGQGFVDFVGVNSRGSEFTPGVKIDEGTIVRAGSKSGGSPLVVTGYLIPK